METVRLASATPRYHALLAALILCLSVTLLAIVDIRRGFLFAEYRSRTPFVAFHSWHAPMLALGVLGMMLCYQQLRVMEQRVRVAPSVASLLAAAIGALLVVDLFAYRVVPATRSLVSGSINVDWLGAFGTTGVWRPVALATSYLLTVWHATMLGILISGLALTALPASGALFRRGGFAGSLGVRCLPYHSRSAPAVPR